MNENPKLHNNDAAAEDTCVRALSYPMDRSILLEVDVLGASPNNVLTAASSRDSPLPHPSVDNHFLPYFTLMSFLSDRQMVVCSSALLNSVLTEIQVQPTAVKILLTITLTRSTTSDVTKSVCCHFIVYSKRTHVNCVSQIGRQVIGCH